MSNSSIIDFSTLINSNNILNLSNSSQSNFIDKLNSTFTTDDQRWYIAHLYMYINYHPLINT